MRRQMCGLRSLRVDWPKKLDTDLLSTETRRRQRNLEIIAVAALLVVLLDLVPTRVSALGIELDKPISAVFY